MICPIPLCTIVITTGSRVVLQAAVDNTVCQYVGVDGKHESDDQVKQLMTILKERERQVVGDNIVSSIICYYGNRRRGIIKVKMIILQEVGI